jgi:hypothetical protein
MNRDSMMTLKSGLGIAYLAGLSLCLDLSAQLEPTHGTPWIEMEFRIEDKTLNAARDA